MIAVSDCPSISGLDCALEIFANIEKLTGDNLRDLKSYSFTQILILVHRGIETVVPVPERVYYLVDEDAAQRIAISAHGNPESLELLLHISTCRHILFSNASHGTSPLGIRRM